MSKIKQTMAVDQYGQAMKNIVKDPTAEQAAKILGVPLEGVRRVYASNANHLYLMAAQAAFRRNKTYRGFSEDYLRERAASYSLRAASS